MEFFEGWKTLNSRFDKGDLTALTQLVGFKLYAISDELRFPDVLRVSDRELMSRTGIQSGQTIVEARRRLKNAGLIDFTTKKNKPTEYRWTLTSANQAPIKHEPSTNQAQEGNPNIRVRDPYTPKPLDKTSNAWEEYWREIGGGRLSEADKRTLSAYEQERGMSWVKAVMQEARAGNNNPRGLSPKFLMAVLARKKAEPTRPNYDGAAALLERMMSD